jgi:surface protein
MFGGTTFKTGIGHWDVSNVTNMSGMFSQSKFSGDISGWNVSGVTDMSGMFHIALDFNADISGWNVANVTDMSYMFYSPWTPMTFNQDISGWNVSNVTNMTHMFYNAQNFNQDISGWNVANVTDMTNMLNYTKLYSINYDSILNTWSNKADAYELQTGVIFGAEGLTYSEGATSSRENLITNYGWDISGDTLLKTGTLTYHISGVWDNNVLPILNAHNSFELVVSTTETDLDDITFVSIEFAYTEIIGDDGFQSYILNTTPSSYQITEIVDFGNIPLSTSGDQFNTYTGGLPAGSAPIIRPGTSGINMFSNTNFETGIGHWDVSGVTNMSYMFYNAQNFNQDISGWKVANVTDMSYMFYNALDFNQDISGWNVANVTDMTNMLNYTKLSSTNYDSILNTWIENEDGLQTGVIFGAEGLKYSEGATISREGLITNYGWDISGDTPIQNGIVYSSSSFTTIIGFDADTFPTNGLILIINTVTSIEPEAFTDCLFLKKILFSDQNILNNIGEKAFSGCTNLQPPLTIPASVTIIGNEAFNLCTTLTWCAISDISGDVHTYTYTSEEIDRTIAIKDFLTDNSSWEIVVPINTVPLVKSDVVIQDLIIPSVSLQPAKIGLFIKEIFTDNNDIFVQDSLYSFQLSKTVFDNIPIFEGLPEDSTVTVINADSDGALNSKISYLEMSDSNNPIYVNMVTSESTLDINVYGRSVRIIKTDFGAIVIINGDGPFEFVDGDAFEILGDNGEIVNMAIGSVSIITEPPPMSNICFPAGEMVKTDKGYKDIVKITSKDTIQGKRINKRTRTRTMGRHLVRVEKGAIGKNVPSKVTLVTPDHKLLFRGRMVEFKTLVKIQGVTMVPYENQILYNILMDRHEIINVNGMAVETLAPTQNAMQLNGGIKTPITPLQTMQFLP